MNIVKSNIYGNIYHFTFENGKSLLTGKESQRVYIVETLNAQLDLNKAYRLLYAGSDSLGEWFIAPDRTITRNEIYTAIDMADSIEKYCKIENCPEGFKEFLEEHGLYLFHFERHVQEGIDGYRIGAYEDLKDPIFYFAHLNGLKYSFLGSFTHRMGNPNLSAGMHIFKLPSCTITPMYAACRTFLFNDTTTVISDIVSIRHLYKDFFSIDFKSGQKKFQGLYKFGEGHSICRFLPGSTLRVKDAQRYTLYDKITFVFKHNYLKENFYKRIEDIKMATYQKCVEKDYICEFIKIEETTTAKEIAMFVGESGFQEDSNFELMVPGNYLVKEHLCSVQIVSEKDFEIYQVI